MPELPEVETSRRGIAPWIEGQRVDDVIIRDARLRWPVRADVRRGLKGNIVRSVRRRAKYLLFDTDNGAAMLHLGMSGSVRIVAADEPAMRHDHVDIRLESGKALRFRDPRRFGSLLWAKQPSAHKLIRDLGPEPLSDTFDGACLHERASGRRVSVKPFIMNANIVVGVGNIYASEALFGAGIHPLRAAGRVSKQRYDSLAHEIKRVLQRAIAAGGTTLRDFHGSSGEAGYFKQELDVYDRQGLPCKRCDRPLTMKVIAQRASYYCTQCQR